MKAVKPDPDPAWGSVTRKVMFFHTGSDLTAFLFSTPCRTPHESKHLNRGGAEGKHNWYDFGLGGSSRTIQSAGRIIKPRGRRYPIRHMMIPFAGVKHLLLSTPPLWGRGVFG